MTSREEQRKAVEAAAQECIRLVKERFGVRAAYLFGSLRGDSPWHEGSDVDIAVEGLAPQDYEPAWRALAQLLPPGVELDLIMLETARPELVARVRGEVPMPEDPKERLKVQIQEELAGMERVVQAAERFLAAGPEQPSELELAGLGKYVHDFYSGAERIWERISVALEEGLPRGERWHVELLEQMQREVEGRRPAVVDPALAAQLLKYLGFRHRFRHIYGEELEWDKLRPLVEGLAETLGALQEQVWRCWDSLSLKAPEEEGG
jgi:predicted nucleotidyltransferase